jgi:alkanesulfonate monooxygenase SsuD/methylene tetrahydromethanopterin reductase-like flavin-dependent oxidoreductase (luciferase family)
MRIGLHYSLQVSKEERSDRAIRTALDDIAWAEQNGFSSAVFAEHHFFEDCWIPRPLQLAAAAAAVTKTMRIGTDIVVLPLHHPVAVAEEAALVDNISGGRFVLGVGLGWMQSEYEGLGVPFKQRAKIYESSISIVRGLLRGETLTDETGHHRFKNARIRPLPVNPAGVPIWMGGVKDVALSRVARMGDAWVMHPGGSLTELARQQNILLEARAATGLPPMMERPLRREVFVAETDRKAWELFAPGLRHEYGHVYRNLYPNYPADDSVDGLRKWGENTMVIGSVGTVAAELRRYATTLGATECLVRFQLPMVPRAAVRECLDGLREVIGLVNR